MEAVPKILETTNVELISTYAVLAVIFIVIAFALYKIHSTINVLSQIADDTLKRFDDKGVLRWSRTSLTMAVAMAVSVYFSVADFMHKGFNYEVFLAWLGVALGSKVTDAWSRKLDPSVQPPSVTKKEEPETPDI